jgi:hypothetical protein
MHRALTCIHLLKTYTHVALLFHFSIVFRCPLLRELLLLALFFLLLLIFCVLISFRRAFGIVSVGCC